MLQKGYTTGVHTSFAFKSAFDVFLSTNNTAISITKKIDNDDLDVTKRCNIVVIVSFDKSYLNLNKISHKPYICIDDQVTLSVYASAGVGIITKSGLKQDVGYPAINPVPIKAIFDIFKNNKKKNRYKNIFCSVAVENGKKIAKQTANSKVGIINGISILGTTGWVKPISSVAYLETIDYELDFASANFYNIVCFTLGNSAFEFVKSSCKDKIYQIDIGNFIYDAIQLAIRKNRFEIRLYIPIAKAIKIAQGYKNTHNRFGSIDFDIVQQWCKEDIQGAITIKRVMQIIKDKQKFKEDIKQKVKAQLYKWFKKNIKVTIV